jgi:hypothetical protein
MCEYSPQVCATIDVLAPDKLGKRARLTHGSGRTIEVPGASQALTRSGVVRVQLVDGPTALIRRPTLVGALLGKLAAATQIVSQSAAGPSTYATSTRSLDFSARPIAREPTSPERNERR